VGRRAPDNTSDISRLGYHPVTPALLATDLAAARELHRGKLGLQTDRKNENAIGFRYGNGTRLDVTQSTVGTTDQQIQEAWQVSDIRAEVAELHGRGIKVEDYDTPGPRPKKASAWPGPPGSSTQPRTSSASSRSRNSAVMSGACLTSAQNVRLCGKPVSRADGRLTVQNDLARQPQPQPQPQPAIMTQCDNRSVA
jgi:hypothetical protein